MIVKVCHSGRSGASSLVRYIAEDELSQELEEERELFSDRHESLTRVDAERYVGGGRMPQAEELVHLIISLSDEEFVSLGESEGEREIAVRDLARRAVGEISGEARTGDLRFVAAVHRNSAYPHVHVAIAREGAHRRLEHIPRSVWRKDGPDPGLRDRLSERLAELARRPERISIDVPGRGLVARDVVPRTGATRDEVLVGRWVTAEAAASRDPGDVPQPQLWGLRRAVRALDAESAAKGELPVGAAIERPELTRLVDEGAVRVVSVAPTHSTRLEAERSARLESARAALGASARADLELAHAQFVYSRIADNSDRLRYTAGEMPTSLRDQSRIAEAASFRAAEFDAPRSSEERDRLLEGYYAASLAEARPVAGVIASKHVKHVNRVRGEMNEAKRTAEQLRPAAIAAQKLYGDDLEPSIGDDGRLELENQAAERGDADALAFLDTGRERPRDAEAHSRLLAWRELGDVTVRSARERLESFDRDRHTRRVDVDGRHWSLAVLDRDAERQARERTFLESRLSAVERRALARCGQSDALSRTLVSLARPRGGDLRQLQLPGFVADAIDRVRALSSRPAKFDEAAYNRALAVREEQLTIERARPVVVAALESERRELARDLSEAERFVRVVDSAIDRMEGRPDDHRVEPAFEPFEIRRLEREAGRSRDVDRIERAVALADSIAETPAARHSRALARELDARVSLEGARERIDRHDRYRDSVPVDVDGQIHRLRQAAPNLLRPVWNVRVPGRGTPVERLLGLEVRFDVHVSPAALRRLVFTSAEERRLERRVREEVDAVRSRHERELGAARTVFEVAVSHRDLTAQGAGRDVKPVYSLDELHRLQVYGAGGSHEPLRVFVAEEVRSAIAERRWERNETFRGSEDRERTRDASVAPVSVENDRDEPVAAIRPASPVPAPVDSLPDDARTNDRTRGQVVALARVLGPVVDIGVRRPNGSMREMTLTVEELDRRIGYLRHANAHGADVFIRPHASTGVVLVDDVSREKLERMRRDGLPPAAVVESSPGNFQAWVRLSKDPVAPALASAAARELAARFDTDTRGVAWNHYGRCPGFTNRKPERVTERGAPFAKLLEAGDRVADRGADLVRESEGRVTAVASLPSREPATERRAGTMAERECDPKTSYERLAAGLAPDIARDASRVDFRVAVGLAREGHDRSFIREAIERGSPDLDERRKSAAYVERTVDRAVDFLSRFRERGHERSR